MNVYMHVCMYVLLMYIYHIIAKEVVYNRPWSAQYLGGRARLFFVYFR